MQPVAYLNTNQAAEKLGISPRTLEKLRVVGGGPVFMKLGRRVLYDPQDLHDWSQARRKMSTSQLSTNISN